MLKAERPPKKKSKRPRGCGRKRSGRKACGAEMSSIDGVEGGEEDGGRFIEAAEKEKKAVRLLTFNTSRRLPRPLQ